MGQVSKDLVQEHPADDRTLHLVVPVYGGVEACVRFLPTLVSALNLESQRFRIVLVDDGNGPEAKARIARAVGLEAGRAAVSMVSLPMNFGKGAAVYLGWKQAGTRDILGFVDADGSVPAAEVARLARCQRLATAGGTAVVAVRTPGAGRRLNRRRHRSFLSFVLAWMTRLLTGIHLSDTQCGCKLVNFEDYERVRPFLREARFSFDIDLLSRLVKAGVQVKEVPVDWAESGSSSVVLVRDIPNIAFGLLRIAARLRYN